MHQVETNTPTSFVSKLLVPGSIRSSESAKKISLGV